MKIDIKNLAKLANLTLTKEQEENLEKSIPSVMEYMDQIKNLDVITFLKQPESLKKKTSFGKTS